MAAAPYEARGAMSSPAVAWCASAGCSPVASAPSGSRPPPLLRAPSGRSAVLRAKGAAGEGGWLPSWVGAIATALPVCMMVGRGRAQRRRLTTGRRAARSSGGNPAPIVRAQKRLEKIAKKERRGIDPNRPPPRGSSGGPTSGAWKEGRPEGEDERQGEYRSPWTGQVYDRWAPIGLKQTGTDRQGGLGRARAYETPKQRQIREALEGENGEDVSEKEKFYPGISPMDQAPRPGAGEKKEKKLLRHANVAGGYKDIFKQLVVHTIVDLRVEKSESPVWYVETCGGEGEYSVKNRKPDMKIEWPSVEALFEVLEKQDMTYMPAELKAWMDSVRFLNRSDEGFDVRGAGAEADPQVEGVQWLPSTALVALRRLRKQDPVTIYEDNPVAFAALFNFVRNFSTQFQAKLEISFKDGFQSVRKIFVEKASESKAHGKASGGTRGVVLVDADWNRGDAGYRCMDTMVRLWTHWSASTVMVTYNLHPDREVKARKFIRSIREKDPRVEMISVEFFVDNPDWYPGSEDEPKWTGCGMLISQPPHTTAERIRASLGVVIQEMSALEGAPVA